MRNIYCGIADIRKRVFAEVAKLAYEGGDYHRMDQLPYALRPGEGGHAGHCGGADSPGHGP